VKLATFQKDKKPRLGIVWGDKIIDYNAGGARLLAEAGKGAPSRPFPEVDLKGFLTQGLSGLRMAAKIEAWVRKKSEESPRGALKGWVYDLAKVRLLAPIGNPPKIMCMARNYVSHAMERVEDGPLFKDLLIFMKPATSVIGPDDPVIVHPECRELDHEVELAVVIGQKGRYIPEEKALDHVAGYTILNDVSDREYVGKKEPRNWINWFFMKAQDGFAPLGPWVVLKDELPEPHGLRLRLWVNGELRQDSEGEEMIFKIPETIARISRFVTLEPGDIIGTGTPRGTSFSTRKYLKAGDVMECEVGGIGRLKNAIRVEEPLYRTK
jgi:2-keto-4-pentenoate hydratase/2-oxohepta-3-ene-1,7-dioic acid hydratase in catechol pathway